MITPHTKKNRKSCRLYAYDYTQEGLYFVTINTKRMREYFGEIHDGTIRLSSLGRIAKKYWLEIPNHFANAELDQFIVMPNHVHGIIKLRRKGEALPRPYIGRISPKPGSLSVIIGSYKSIVTKQIRKYHFDTLFAWQRNYYDHIIRNEKDLNRVRQYIIDNPKE